MAVGYVGNCLNFNPFVVRVGGRKRAQISAHISGSLIVHVRIVTQLAANLIRHRLGLRITPLQRRAFPRVFKDNHFLVLSDLTVSLDTAQHAAVCVEELFDVQVLLWGWLNQLVAFNAAMSAIEVNVI